jgi:hypothetical protein
MIKQIFLLLIMAAGSIPAAFASDFGKLQDFGFSADQAERLGNGERLSNLTRNFDDLALMPQTAFADRLRESIGESRSKTFVEALYYIPTLTDASQLALVNSLLKISTLSGLQYYSRSEKITKTLIYSVSIIGEPGSKDFLPDLTVTQVPEQITFLFNQDDETFGAADYEALLQTDRRSGEISIAITNLDPLKQSVIKVADVRGMHTYLLAIPCDEGVLLYGLITNAKAAPSIIRNRMNESLLNRLDALKLWFVERYPR